MGELLMINPHAVLKRRIWFVCGATLMFSLVAFAAVLVIQRSVLGPIGWDFQGATGAATVIPSFAGVLLAAWAIYFQVRTSSPSHKAAERLWMEISELYQRALKVGAILATVETAEPTHQEMPEVDESDIDEMLRMQAEDPHRSRVLLRRTAAGYSAGRCGAEFKILGARGEDGSKTLAELAVAVFPILDSLQQRLSESDRIDLISLESDIDVVGASFDLTEDYPELSSSIEEAARVLRKIIELIQALKKYNLLSLEEIEAAVLRPSLPATVKAWFDDHDVNRPGF